jgi:hypothetical protein
MRDQTGYNYCTAETIRLEGRQMIDHRVRSDRPMELETPK